MRKKMNSRLVILLAILSLIFTGLFLNHARVIDNRVSEKKTYNMLTFSEDLEELNNLLVKENDPEKMNKISERFDDYSQWVQENINVSREINKFYEEISKSLNLKNVSSELKKDSPEKMKLPSFPPPKTYSLADFR